MLAMMASQPATYGGLAGKEFKSVDLVSTVSKSQFNPWNVPDKQARSMEASAWQPRALR